MKTGLNGVPLVPSPAVLRFLRIQTECLRFLHTSRAVARSSSCLARASRPRQQLPIKSQHDTRSRVYSINHKSAHIRTRSLDRALVSSVSPRCSCTPKSAVREFVRTASAWSAKGREKPWETWRTRRKGLEPNDLPLPLALEDTGSIGRAIKPGSELMLRCTEFDASGNVTLINGEFKKTELIQKVRQS